MKIYLDLLPEERKKEIKKNKLFGTVIRQESRLLIPLAVFIAVLIAINIILEIQAEGMEKAYSLKQSQEKYIELKTYEGKFKEINMKIANASGLQEGHLYWSEVLYELSTSVPDDVYVVDLSTKDYQIFLTGKAKNRDNLLDFQGRLESSGCFDKINVPLSNLVSKENVSFQMDFEIKKDCLKNK